MERLEDSVAVSDIDIYRLTRRDRHLHLELDRLVLRLVGVKTVIVDKRQPEIIALRRGESVRAAEPIRVVADQLRTRHYPWGQRQEAY